MASVNLPVSLMEEDTAAEPVPVREMMWGLPVALSVMVMAPVLVPVAVGVKVTLMVQLPADRHGGSTGVGLGVVSAGHDTGDVEQGSS